MANERASGVVAALVQAVRQVIRWENVQYPEFHAAVGFLQKVAASAEIPLLLAVLLEATVDEVTHSHHEGSTTTIQGPFYIPGAPLLERPYALPQRPNEAGETLTMSGTVSGPGGRPLEDAELDMWQATAEVPGQYSNVHPGIPDSTCAAGSGPTLTAASRCALSSRRRTRFAKRADRRAVRPHRS